MALSPTSSRGSSASASGLTLITTQTADGSSANLDFTGIAATYQSLLMIFTGRSDTASSLTNVSLRLNNDSAANYAYFGPTANNVTIPLDSSYTATSAKIGQVPAATATAARAAYGQILLPWYADAVFNKPIFGQNGHDDAAAVTGSAYNGFEAVWRSSAAVTRLTLILAAGVWVTGSKAALYGFA